MTGVKQLSRYILPDLAPDNLMAFMSVYCRPLLKPVKRKQSDDSNLTLGTQPGIKAVHYGVDRPGEHM
jgi:hypothetical protein